MEKSSSVDDEKLVKQLQVEPGAAVEVKFDEENLRDIWFPATVVKDVGDGSFLVEYLSSIECGLMKVVVDYLHIRKQPPCMRRESFELLEKVDWFNGFGWYSGVVTKVLGDGSYIVFFKSTRKEKNLSLEDIRPHIDWVNGKWIDLPEFDHEVKHPTPHVLTLKMDQKEKDTCNIEKSPNGSHSVSSKRIKPRKTVVYMRGNPIMKSKGETQADAPLHPEISLVKAVEQGESKTEWVNDSLAGGGDQLSEELTGNGKMICQNLETEIKLAGLTESQSTKRRRGRPPKNLMGTPRAMGAAVRKVEANDVAETPIVLGLLSGSIRKPAKVGSMSRLNKVKSVKAVKDDKDPHETVFNDEENGGETMKDDKNLHEKVFNHEENKEQKDSNLTVPKRKRGRPAKVKVDGSSATQAVNGKTSAGAQLCSSNEVGLAVVDSVSSQNKQQKLVKLIDDQTNTSSNVHRKNERSPRNISSKRKRGRRKRKILNGAFMTAVDQPQAQVFPSFLAKAESLVPDIQDVLPLQSAHDVANGSMDDREPSAVSNISDDDKPLSTWFEGAQSLQEPDEARISRSRCQGKAYQNQAHAQVVDRCNKAAPEKGIMMADNKPEDGIQPGAMNNAIIPVVESIVMDDQNLPFDKSTLVWQTIQSMEIFRVLPQRPHFLPLYNCKEETREGLAIGNMVTFAGLVEKVSKFQLDDPRTILDSSMETLADLEKHGFDVKVVRSRLRQLISIKSIQEEHLNSRLEIENQIIDQTLERMKIQEEISEMDKKIAELQEKRSAAAALEAKKISELRALESSVVDINASIDSSRAEFGRVAASSW